MELIEEVETTRRGLYGGVLGYLDFAGNADFAIAIRTALMRDGTRVRAGRRGRRGRFQRTLRVQRGARTRPARCCNAIAAAETLTAAVMRIAPACCWCLRRWRCGWRRGWRGSRCASFDGLGQPKTATLSGAAWSTALVPLALLVLAAAVAALAVRGWPLRLLAVLVAVASAGMGYLAIGLWVIRDVAVRAADLAQVPGGRRWSARSGTTGVRR